MLKTIKQKRSFADARKRFAEVHELVPFGSLKSTDDIQRPRGVTFSRDSSDSNYMHGNSNGYEVTFLTRTAQHGPTLDNREQADWTVIAIELHSQVLPHVIFDNKKHDRKFYKSIMARYPRLRLANPVLHSLNESAAFYFDVYCTPEASLELGAIFSDEILQRMTFHYGKFDVEVYSNQLFIFARGTHYSFAQLQDMQSEALWLASRIDMRSSFQPTEATASLSLVAA